MNLEEHNWNIYTEINGWIRFADSKAGAIIALNSIIIGFIASNLSGIKLTLLSQTSLQFVFVVGCLSLILSLFFSIKCILPKLNTGEPESNIYFRHIAEKFNTPDELNTYIDENPNFSDDLIAQIWANSRVANDKYSDINKSIKSFTSLLLFTLIYLLILLVQQT